MLFSLLTFPVSGPVSGLRWILETVQDQAYAEYYDIAAIRRQLEEIEAAIASGDISQEEGDQRAGELVERLMEAQDYHAGNAEEERGEWDGDRP